MFTTPIFQPVSQVQSGRLLPIAEPAHERARKPAAKMVPPVPQATGMTLRGFAVFAATALPPLEDLAKRCTVRRVGPNTPVLRAGEPAKSVYLVQSDSLNVLAANEEGRETILAMLNQGDLFGEMGVLDEQTRCASVTTSSPCLLIAIPGSDFKSFMSVHFEVTEYLMRQLVRRLRNASRQIERLALQEVPGRVLGMLKELGETEGADPYAHPRHSIQDIAKMVGASREMVSRVMNDLVRRGQVVVVDKRFVLPGLIPAQQAARGQIGSFARRGC